MQIVSSILLFVIFVCVLCFAAANQQAVAIGFWPFSSNLSLPLYLLGLLPLAFGLVVGGFGVWLTTIPHRLKVRRLQREMTTLNDKIDDLQKTAVVQQAPPRRSWWKTKR